VFRGLGDVPWMAVPVLAPVDLFTCGFGCQQEQKVLARPRGSTQHLHGAGLGSSVCHRQRCPGQLGWCLSDGPPCSRCYQQKCL